MLDTGSPHPLGATCSAAGINFALAAPAATRVELCIFDAGGRHEQQRIPLPACTDGIWHGRLPGGRAGLVYGYRVHGPWAPREGHRFNPAKLVLDPYAREVVGRYDGSDLFVGHDPADPASPDARDNARVALKARALPRLPPQPAGHARVAAADRVLYELHVRGQTYLHPGVDPGLRGSYAGLAAPPVLDHLQQLGVTTLSLMPVQQRADEARLLGMGLSNYWGYSTIGWFAPEPRYWSGREGTTPESEFRELSAAVHARDMELLIDVVYNHSAETDEIGPTLSLRGIDNAMYYHLRADDRARYQNWTGCGNCLNLAHPQVVRLVMDSLRHWVCELGVDGFRFDLAPVLARRAGGAFDPQAALLAAMAQDPVLATCVLVAEPWDIGPDGYRLGQFPPGWLEWNDCFRDAQRGFWLHRSVTRGEFAQRFTASSDRFRHDGRAPTASVNYVTAHDGFTLRDLVSHAQRHNLANGEDNRDGHGHNLSRNFGVEGDTDDPAVLGARERARRALLATLLWSQGTPMLLAGDEIGRTQRGNNNAYCQDNAITWLDWAAADTGLATFVAQVLALRREAAPLRAAAWWPEAAAAGAPGLHWRTPDGDPMAAADWPRTDRQAIAIHFEPAAPAAGWLLLVNAEADAVAFALPPGPWQCRLRSDRDDPVPDAADPCDPARWRVAAGSIWLAKAYVPAAGDGASVANPPKN